MCKVSTVMTRIFADDANFLYTGDDTYDVSETSKIVSSELDTLSTWFNKSFFKFV